MNASPVDRLEDPCRASDTELRPLADEAALTAFLTEAADIAADDDAPPPTRLLEDGRGFTLADGLIAATGSIVITGRRPGARRVAFLAETHFALVAEEDIHDDLAALLGSAGGANWRGKVGHHVTFITGPSRTADIEKQMVLGAHGPRRLVLGVAPTRLLRARFGDTAAADGDGRA